MAGNSKIEWCDATWNPVRGCTRVSEGCKNCYAEVMAARFNAPGQWGHGFAEIVGTGARRDHRWTGRVELIESQLTLPLRWRKPRRIFVNSTSDLFHEALPDAAIDRVFAVMALCPQHTFQVLTKRPERMRAYLSDEDLNNRLSAALGCMLDGDWIWTEGKRFRDRIERLIDVFIGQGTDNLGDIVYHDDPMPLPNVWLGTSVEDQATADERIPHLLATPAAIRFVSAEPLLGRLDPSNIRLPNGDVLNALTGEIHDANTGCIVQESAALDQIIVGGESGPNARPFDLAWARSILAQCKAAEVPCFVKQLGTKPIGNWGDQMRHAVNFELHIHDKKGGDWSEWPTDLRVREFPNA